MTASKDASRRPRLLVVIADFYAHIAKLQLEAIEKTLCNRAAYDVIHVPGALEISVVIAAAAQQKKYDGYVALGCVIRGETTHYEIVCHETSRALTDLGVQQLLAIGNGVLTVENEDQALARADFNLLNKAGGAAEACLAVLNIFEQMKDKDK